MSDEIQRRVRVSGRVQGVGFRASLEAELLNSHRGLRGWVANLEDGRVEAVFLGPQASVLSLLAWCRKGPSAARVEKIEVSEEDADQSLGPFRIKSLQNR